jgi:hypothetical protein
MQQHTTYYHSISPTPPTVKVTRRHHPLLGQACEVLQGGPGHLIVRVEGGAVMRLPRTWTDADGLSQGAAGTEAVFTVDAVRELSEVVEALRQRGDG